ncbi:MAG: glycosyl transferase, partial [Lachnospiraceae bacterium]|nr:glycosyl transferase [Lachnospiraceae bacterium]
LNTFRDGFKVIKTVIKFFKTYKPLAFFGALAGVLVAIAAALFIPVLVEYFQTGLVARFPTLIVSGFIAIAAIQSFFAGLILHTIIEKDKQDFEFKLQLISGRERRS